MHLLFLDESGQLQERKLFALGGLALRDSDWHELRDLWQQTLSEHGWPPDREVKWHGIRRGEVPPALADAVVSALARAPVTCYVTLLDVELGHEVAPEFFSSDEDTYATGLMFLAERFQLLLEREDDVGMIVVDSRFREEDSRLRRFFADLTKDGTPYSRLERIVEASSSGRASTRSACSAPTSSSRSPPPPSAARARRAGTCGRCSPASPTIPRPARSRASASSASPSACRGPARRRSSSSRPHRFGARPKRTPPVRLASDGGEQCTEVSLT